MAAMAGISLVAYIYAIYIRPEYAQLPEQKGDEAFLHLLRGLGNTQNKKICAYCQIEKPEKARHCFTCKRCVLEHDNHSFMLNNCVGKANRKFVITYLSTTSILLTSIVASAIAHWAEGWHYLEKREIRYARVFLSITGALASLLLVFYVYRAVFHCRKAGE